jgi:hypothetical protein
VPRGISELATQAWRLYRSALQRGDANVVLPSIPILFFGDLGKYQASPLRVITVGLNPSLAEFPPADPFARFPAARDVYPQILEGIGYDAYLRALGDYFRVNPYSRWFESFERLLLGLDASFYEGSPNTALHSDLCSPLATNPTWSRLGHAERARLAPEGIAFWHRLVPALDPHVIIISVARAHLDNIRFPMKRGWQDLYRLERVNPFVVECAELEVRDGRTSTIVFGRAANTPFGTVSDAEKRRIGEAIGRYRARR